MKARGALAFAAVALASLWVRPADACNGRPTDAAGYLGFTYGAVAAKSFATADVRVHYAPSGEHAPDLRTTRSDSVPDMVAFAAETAQAALGKYAEMGYRKIPSDESCPSNGGDAKVDIYLVKFPAADGATAPEACNGSSCSSFVLVESTFLGRGYPSVKEGFQTVVVHELFHAVQNVYDKELERFWAEGSAQWAMKTLHPHLVDFENQLPAFFAQPNKSLDAPPGGVTAGFLYGSAVWPLFLSLRHGPETVREILELEGEGQKTLVATDAVLAKKGSSLAEAFPLFAAWNVATKKYAGEGGYPDAAKYPGVKTATLADGVNGITSGLSYFAYAGTLDGPSSVSLETDEARNAGMLVPIEGGKARVDKAAKLPANGEGEVLVVVAGTTTKKTDARFTVHIGPPVQGPGASSSSSSGGSSGGDDDGGCRAAPSGSASAEGIAPGVFVALGALLSRRCRRRRRSAEGGRRPAKPDRRRRSAEGGRRPAKPDRRR
jgi:hypothetical protein